MTPKQIQSNEKKRQQLSFRRAMRLTGCAYELQKYLGTDIWTARRWMESKMTPEMTWENYGSFWQIDHIVPLRMFDVFNEVDLRICWHYKNLMPVTREDNLKKEGNVYFSYNLLLPLKDKDYFYSKLFEKVEQEMIWMNKYIKVYNGVPSNI